jgi:hypothetical protein
MVNTVQGPEKDAKKCDWSAALQNLNILEETKKEFQNGQTE